MVGARAAVDADPDLLERVVQGRRPQAQPLEEPVHEGAVAAHQGGEGGRVAVAVTAEALEAAWRPEAIVAWALGASVSLLGSLELFSLTRIAALDAMLVAAASYYLITRLRGGPGK